MATVVVLDDDAFVRQFVCRLLEMFGHHVRSYPDAKPALDEVDFSEVDLVITDLQMPTSGEVLIKTIRERGFDVPIVVMSGHVEPEKVDYYMGLGAQSILLKPFSLENFWKITGAWICKVGNQKAV